jgi:hypothetical protein
MIKLQSLSAGAIVTMLMAGCGGGGPGAQLSGAYVPQFAPGASRFDRSSADRRWEFLPDGTVVTQGHYRTVKWSYEVRGKQIRLTGIDNNNRGERRTFTRADGECIWDGHGTSSVDVRFCPAQ